MKQLLLIYFFLQSIAVIAQKADLVLVNGKIFTSDKTNLYVEALAIKSNKIIAIGKTADIEKMANNSTKKIDLQGKLVIPGFNDAHNHMPDGLDAFHIVLKEMNPTWTTVADTLKKVVTQIPKGKWIEVTIGPSIANSENSNRFELDKISDEHPIRLLSWWGHVGIYNTLGMKKMGISITQPDPKGAHYERVKNSDILTGKAFEKNAWSPYTSYDRLSSMRNEKEYITELQGISKELMQAGITSYQNMCTGAIPQDYVKFWQKAGCPFRLRLIKWADIAANGSFNIPSINNPNTEVPNIKISGTKWLLDGTPIEQGAFKLSPYPNRPEWFGKLNYSKEEIKKMCLDAIKRKDQLIFHIVGGGTIKTVLSVMEKINVDWKSLRPRFEHCDDADVSEDFLARIKKLGIIIVQNPTHLVPFDGNFPQGGLKKGLPLKSIMHNGIPLAIGSDGATNPFLNLMLAITHPVRPSEALTLEDALIAYTKTSAFAEFEENKKGTLTIGKLADLTILSQDIFKVIPPDLLKTVSLLTMVNGKIVYNSGVISVN